MASAVAEAAKAKEQFNSEPSEPGGVCWGPLFSRAHSWPWKPGRAWVLPWGLCLPFKDNESECPLEVLFHVGLLPALDHEGLPWKVPGRVLVAPLQVWFPHMKGSRMV